MTLLTKRLKLSSFNLHNTSTQPSISLHFSFPSRSCLSAGGHHAVRFLHIHKKHGPLQTCNCFQPLQRSDKTGRRDVLCPTPLPKRWWLQTFWGSTTSPVYIAELQAGMRLNPQVASGRIIPAFQRAMEINPISEYLCWRLVISLRHLRTRINSYWVQAENYHH